MHARPIHRPTVRGSAAVAGAGSGITLATRWLPLYRPLRAFVLVSRVLGHATGDTAIAVLGTARAGHPVLRSACPAAEGYQESQPAPPY